MRSLNFARTEERAATMTVTELIWSRRDARETAELWDRAGIENDPDGNAGYYRDEATVDPSSAQFLLDLRMPAYGRKRPLKLLRFH